MGSNLTVGRHLTIRINKNSLMYGIMIIPFVPISFLSEFFSFWSTFYFIARILVLMFFLIKLIFIRKNISVPLILALLLVASAFFSAFMVNENYYETFRSSVFLIGVTLLIEDGLFFDKTALINGLLVFFEILVYINLLYFIFFPQGYHPASVANRTYYFLGNHNTTIKFLMPGVALGILKAFSSKGRITVRLSIMLAAILIFCVGAGATTNMIAMIICIIGLLYYNFRRKSGVFRFEIFIIVSIILTFIFVITGRYMVFADFIIGVLGKDMTLSMRTSIWDKAFSLIAQSPIWGYGQASAEMNRMRMGGDAAHNILLDTLYFGGIIELIILILIFIIIGRRLFQCRKKFPTVAVAFDCVFCAYFIMWTFNPYGDIQNFYLLFAVLVMAFHYEEIVPYVYRSG